MVRATYIGITGVQEKARETLDLLVGDVGFYVLLEGGGGVFGGCGGHGVGLLACACVSLRLVVLRDVVRGNMM